MGLAEGEFIPLAAPYLAGDEWPLVKDCLDTGWVSSAGSYVGRFEEATASYVGTSHAVALSSGTAALHLALQVAGVGAGDLVIAPDLTFIATVNAIRYVGADPVLIDAEPRYMQMDVDLVLEFVDSACDREGPSLVHRATGRRIKAFLPVHILGHPTDVDPLLRLSEETEAVVIEDAAEALGGTYRGRPVGSLGTLSCLSFNGNKIVTAGGGGMVLTDDPAYAERCRYLATQAKDDPLEYVHNAIGYNYRLTNLQAALGYGQMMHLNRFIERKRRIAASYRRDLGNLSGVAFVEEAPWAEGNGWLTAILVEDRGVRRELIDVLASAGIEARPLWQPMHQSAAHAGSLVIGGEVASQLQARAVCLPSSVGLTDAQQERVIYAVRSFFD